MRARRALIVSYSAAQMFALVDAIESYPEFLPWCEAVEVSRDGEEVHAVMYVQYAGVKTHLATNNRHCRPSQIDMALASGSLKSLHGRWFFCDLGDGRCRVEFDLAYEFKAGYLETLFGGLFARVFGKFVESFIARAQAHYGQAGRGNISVTVADRDGEQTLTLPVGATVGDALAASGRTAADTVGIFGRVCRQNEPLDDGMRVEIYESLVRDPRTARRARAGRGT